MLQTKVRFTVLRDYSPDRQGFAPQLRFNTDYQLRSDLLIDLSVVLGCQGRQENTFSPKQQETVREKGSSSK